MQRNITTGQVLLIREATLREVGDFIYQKSLGLKGLDTKAFIVFCERLVEALRQGKLP